MSSPDTMSGRTLLSQGTKKKGVDGYSKPKQILSIWGALLQVPWTSVAGSVRHSTCHHCVHSDYYMTHYGVCRSSLCLLPRSFLAGLIHALVGDYVRSPAGPLPDQAFPTLASVKNSTEQPAADYYLLWYYGMGLYSVRGSGNA